MDGFGLAMFLPILQMANGDKPANASGMGNLSFIADGLKAIHIELTLTSTLVVMLLFFTCKGLAKYATRLYRVYLQQSLIRKIRLQMLRSLNGVTFKYFVTTDTGRIQNTMTGEVDRIAQAYQSYFGTFEGTVLVVVYMGFAFYIDYQFAILVSIGGALTNILYNFIYKYTKGASKKLTANSNIYQGQVIQHVGNYKYLRATGMTKNFSKRLIKTIYLIEQSRRKIGILSGFLEAAREPMLIGIVVIVILVQVKVFDASLGSILISLLFFYRALNALTTMQNAWNNFIGVSGSIENLQSFITELKSNQNENGERKIASFTSKIELKNASFSYGDTLILDKIDLVIEKNKSIAFVGESGSGKTTLVNIIAGLLSPDSGDIIIDGVPYKEIDINTVQYRIGYITQEPVIFHDSIYNNITFWAEPTEQNKTRFKKVIEQAAINNFIDELPEKEQTVLGTNGINLSGGQKQRIAIARELYKEIDILIMDEATSALDTATERDIQQNIDNLKGEYTILIIAHRLSTIKNTDEVVVMNKGTIEKIGIYPELMEESSSFRKMTELQNL